jgi:hypothetical protein
MGDRGYSTTMDALLFLVMVSTCAVIMSPVIMGHGMERASTDRSLRELAASALVCMETERVDYFEYRILGDLADQIAAAGGVNTTNDFLYREVTRSVLGRGCRHSTVMDLAADDAACQFLLCSGNDSLRLNPLTTEYDRQAKLLADQAIRSRIDQRYGYEFTLRWMPFTGVPLEGNITAGKPHPPGAMSVQTFVTMPYTTNITNVYLGMLNKPDLEAINRSIAEYRLDEDRDKLETDTRQSIQRCLANSTRAEVHEIWNNTLGSGRANDRRVDPASTLEAFSTGEVSTDQLMADAVSLGEDAIVQMIVVQNQDSMNALVESCVAGVEQNGDEYDDVEFSVLSWLHSRYEPSRARVTLSVWVGP